MVFGVQKIVTVQESYTIWQKNKIEYSLFVLSVCVCKHSMDLIGKGKCATWIATELSWRNLTHAFWTHKCMFGLARVQVRLALHIFNTNNNALLMFECSFTLEIVHLWKLICYFELAFCCVHKSQKVVETLRIPTNEVCKSTYHIFALLLGCNNNHWALCNHILDYILNWVAICDGYLLPWHIS